MKEIELIIEDENIEGVNAMGIVSYPAIEKGFYYYSQDQVNKYQYAKVDNEQGIIVSPALIPDKRIIRTDPLSGEQYMVWMSQETIRKISEQFLINNYQNNITYEHENPITGVKLIYSWIVENEWDPIITKYGYSGIPVGTWVVSYKIFNEGLKQDIKEGRLKGISIEGFFTEKFCRYNKEESLMDRVKQILLEMEK